MVESSTLENISHVDELFYENLDIKILDIRKDYMKKTFNRWYKDWVERLYYLK